MSALYQQLERTEADLAAAHAEIERLKDKCSQYIEKAYDKTIEVNNFKAEIERLKAALQRAHEGWQAEVAVIRSIADDNLARAEKAEAERDEAQAAEAEYRRKNHALTNERDEATATIELVNSNNLTLAAELAGWKQAARQMEAERDALQASLKDEMLEHQDTVRLVDKAEAERDEARAQVAAAFEAAARRTESEDVEYPSGVIDMEGEELREILRALTPAHAKAALEAYGREKVREGMKRAAEIIRGCCPECLGTGVRDSGGVHPWGEPISVPCDCTDAILAAMEALK